MPDLDDLKNKAEGALGGAKDMAEKAKETSNLVGEGMAEKVEGFVDSHGAQFDGAAEKVDAAFDKAADTAVNLAEKLSGKDLDGDGTVAGGDAPAAGDGKGLSRREVFTG